LVSEVETTFGVSSDVAKALVPDGLLSCKAATHLDAPVVLYSHGGDALWVRSGRDARDDDAVLFPTLYTLARCPTLLPIIGTAPPVIAKLTTGADLMAPGVSMSMLADLPDLPAATLVAVASVDEPAVPKAVGQLAVSKRELAGHGKAVVTLHAIGDHLWLAGSQESAQPLAGSSRAASGQAAPAKDAQVPDVGALAIDDGPVASSSSAPLPAKEVDAILRTALLYAIANTLPRQPKDYPITASTLVSAHILPARPAHCDPDQVDFKHASKKLSPWIKAMTKEGLISSKEMKELVITSVNAQHKDVLGLKSYKTLGDVAKKQQAAAHADDEPAVAGQMKLTDLWRPYGHTLSFFLHCGHTKDAYLTGAEIRKTADDYALAEKLIHPVERKFIVPDQRLLEALLSKKADPEDARNVEAGIARPDAVERLQSGMQRWHALERDGEEPVLSKGPATGIVIAIKKRQGAKVVCCITGIENFQLDPAELADTLQHVCASSSAWSLLPNSTPKQPHPEVTVQGDQHLDVVKLLASRGVPKRFIEYVPLAAGKKGR